MAKEWGLEKLPEDLLLHILFLTDIYTVLTVCQVNAFFRAVASTKQLWLLLIKSLSLRGLIDIPSDEVNLDLSSDELIAQVKRAVCGPRTWSPTSPTAPTSTHRFTIQLEHPASFSSLVPGGRYIVFRHRGVECYDVATGRRAWTWSRPDFQVLETNFSVCRGSRVTVILTIWGLTLPGDVRLVILEVNLENGHSREILQFPSMRVEGLRLKNLQSAEGYLGCNMLAPGNDALDSRWIPFLVNLRTEQYILFDCELILPNDFHIISGYLLLVNSRSEPLSVRLYSIPSLGRLWRSLSDFNLENATSESVIIPTATVPVTGDVGPRHAGNSDRVYVNMAASLLREKTYLLRVLDTVVHPLLSTNIIKATSIFRLDLSKQTPLCTLLSTFTQSASGPLLEVSPVSRAGFRILGSSAQGVRVVRLDDGEAAKFINCEGAHLGRIGLPHNGGLVLVCEKHAELLYYD